MDFTFKSIAAVVGVATLASTTWNLASFVYLYIRPSSLPRYLTTSDGSEPWAFITGASDGIGKAFAFDLASRGFNIVLYGRNPDKLGAVKAELEKTHPSRKFRVVVADASRLSDIDFETIASSISDITLKILINNAGVTMPRGHEYDTIENYTVSELEANIAVNGTFPILLTRTLIPSLITKQPSLILNIGSFADMDMPLFPAYGPAKSMLMASTRELVMEQSVYSGRDIEVLGLRAMQVTNTGTIKVPVTMMVPEPATWVRSALGRVGCGRDVVVPYFLHAMQEGMLGILPDGLRRKAKVQAMKDNMALDATGAQAEIRAREEAKKEL